MSRDSFVDLVERVQAGDEGAASELIDRYGEHVQRVARIRLNGSCLRRVVDSADICQSVMMNFFRHATTGELALERPQQLIALLAKMTTNQVYRKAEFHQAQRRDIRRTDSGDENFPRVAGAGSTPSMIVSRQELRHRVLGQLSEQERYLLEQRTAGRSWVDIGSELDVQPDRIRKQLTRALTRVSDSLGLAEKDDSPE